MNWDESYHLKMCQLIFKKKHQDKLFATLVIEPYIPQLLDFIREIKEKQIVVGWEFFLKGDDDYYPRLFSGIALQENRQLILISNPFLKMKEKISHDESNNLQLFHRIIQNYFQEKKPVSLTGNGETDIYQRFSQMNNELVNLQRKIVKQNSILEAQKEQFRITLSGIGDAVISIDSREKIIFVNPKACQLLQKKKDQLQGQNLWQVFRIFSSQKPEHPDIGKILYQKGFYQAEEVKLQVSDQHSKYIAINMSLIYRKNKQLQGAVLIFRDISERKKRERLIEQFASIDMLTGVYNRRFGLQLLEKEINTAKRRDSVLTLCFVDIDNLKGVNDRYGHQEGDRLLVNFCNTITNNIRTSDIFCRMGGDEFLIIFPDSRQDKAEKIWQRILDDLANLNEEKRIKTKYVLQASHGLVEFNKTMDNANQLNENVIDRLIEIADKRMYQEKRNNKKEQPAL